MKSCIKHWWLPVTVKANNIYSIAIKIILCVTALDLIVYSFQLSSVVNNLYGIDIKTGETKLTNNLAVPYPDIVLTKFYYSLIGMLLVALTMLPLIFFYQHYMESKSIYTMLRLREKRIRIKFYIENIAVSVAGILLIFPWQTLLYMIGYLMYSIIVPYNNQPAHDFMHIWHANLIQRIYQKPYLFPIVPICIAILLPALAMLAAFAERNKRRSLLALLGILFGIFGMYAMWADLGGYPVIILLSSITAVLLGIYYINKVQLA